MKHPILRARPWMLCLTVAFWLTAGSAAAHQALSGRPQVLRWEPLDIATRHGVRHFEVEVADTDGSREIGLMYRKHLATNRGMLFDFKTPQDVSFWMKNTWIPLDMLFIAADGRIISIARDAIPMSEAPIPSGGATLGVLEVRGGLTARMGIQPGDLVHERIFKH